uniref:Uncharacterized protein n=1 Tax=Anguilla anguilla TaxID=7936 RepID=A0A0E9TL02_ANGAN
MTWESFRNAQEGRPLVIRYARFSEKKQPEKFYGQLA